MRQPQENNVSLLPRPHGQGLGAIGYCKVLLSLLDGAEEELQVLGLDIEEVDNDLFATNLAKGVEELADGVLYRNEVLGGGGAARAPRLLATTPRQPVLEVGGREERYPLWQVRI